ncbi:hypothetical protein J5N97_020865 [Dioscorea zingiberensis]|uniref:Uncharacterized protein n=1 Tax=Dioscorea zingiberensis TaxID=325984 RepID=A0A9D5CGK3_9LILI|nr:hypothetical protein J5N97_020865 [Dioscorea zingiberensis]
MSRSAPLRRLQRHKRSVHSGATLPQFHNSFPLRRGEEKNYAPPHREKSIGGSLFLFFMDTETKVSLEFYSQSLEFNNNDNHGPFQHNQQEQPLSDCISNTITGFSASMELDGGVEVREIGGGNPKELEPQLEEGATSAIIYKVAKDALRKAFTEVAAARKAACSTEKGH